VTLDVANSHQNVESQRTPRRVDRRDALRHVGIAFVRADDQTAGDDEHYARLSSALAAVVALEARA
jgi:hypothetical protein